MCINRYIGAVLQEMILNGAALNRRNLLLTTSLLVFLVCEYLQKM